MNFMSDFRESLSTFRTLHNASPHAEVPESIKYETDLAQLLGFKDNEDFIKWIEGKRVLDMGSGLGGLAVSVADLGINAHVVSLDINMGSSEFKEHQKGHIAGYYQSELEDNPGLKTKVLDLQKEHNRLAVKGAWPELPFGNETFDRVISANSFPTRDVSTTDQVELLIERLSQVLKEEGEIRLSPVFPNANRKYRLLDESGGISNFLSEQLEKNSLKAELFPLKEGVQGLKDKAYCLIIKKFSK